MHTHTEEKVGEAAQGKVGKGKGREVHTQREPSQRLKDWRADRQHRVAATALRTENVLELQRPVWERPGQAQLWSV